MERWHLPSVEATGKREPRVLFSRSEARAVLIDLSSDDEMGEHSSRENALIQVVSGRLAVSTGGQEVECDAGMLVTFEPGEIRSLRALEPSRVLLLLAPWPGVGHFAAGEDVDPERMPSNATAPPLS